LERFQKTWLAKRQHAQGEEQAESHNRRPSGDSELEARNRAIEKANNLYPRGICYKRTGPWNKISNHFIFRAEENLKEHLRSQMEL